MCFVLVLYRVNPRYPIVIAANRDERRSRATRAPFRWPGNPAIWAGRDEQAGGTWLGVNERGLLAAITNRRDAPSVADRPSRGGLCLAMLHQPSAEVARATFEEMMARQAFNPFNLLCLDPGAAWLADWRGQAQSLTPGAHVVTSHGDADDGTVTKICRANGLLAKVDLAMPLPRLLDQLGRICADTSEPDPICRVGGEYGSVSSSLIAIDTEGAIAAYLHADGPPSVVDYRPILPLESDQGDRRNHADARTG